MNIAAQICVFVFGLTAVWLVNDPRPALRRWGPVSGLVSQPFWFYATITGHQWGIFAAAIVYTYLWARGFYYQWIRK